MGNLKKVVINNMVTHKSAAAKAGGTTAVTLPNPPTASTYDGPSPVAQGGPETQSVNAQLDTVFATSLIGLKVTTHRGQLSYVLMHHNRGAPQKTAGLRIAAYSTGTAPIITAKGVLVPLPYGFDADRLAANPDLPFLQLKEQAFGEKSQSYVFIPLHPVSDLDELGHTGILFDAIRAKLDRGKVYKLLDIDVAKEVKRFPVYRIVAIDISAETPIAIGTRNADNTSPLFRLRPQSASSTPKPLPPTDPTPDAMPKAAESSPQPFSLGSLNVRGAHICFVVDGSGSTAELMLRASKGLDILYDQLPAIAYPFVKLSAVTTRPESTAQIPLSAMSVATLGQLRTIFASPSYQGDTEYLELGINRCRRHVIPDPGGSVFKGIVVLTDTDAPKLSTEAGTYVLPLDGDITTVTQEAPDILRNMFKPDPPPVPLATRLRKKGMAEDRARQVEAVMAALEPIGADTRSALYTKIMNGWQDVMAAVRDGNPSKLIERLASRHHGDQPERVTQFAVAALRLMPTEVMAAHYPLLQQLLKENHDDKLMQETSRTIAALFRQVSHEGRATLYLAHLRRDPNAVPVADLLSCGRTPTTLRALLHVIRYGRDEEAALKGLLILYTDPPLLADERPRVVEALGFKYATAVHMAIPRYEGAAAQLGISVTELKGEAP